MNRIITLLLVLVCVASVLPALSYCVEREQLMPREFRISAEEIVLIHQPGDGSFRVLMTFPGLDELRGKEVYAARLILANIVTPEEITMQVSRITTAWDPATVDWDTPWESLGGDYTKRSFSSVHLTAYRNPLRPVWFDVTRHVYATAQLDEPNYGFMFKPPDELAVGYEGTFAALFESVGSVTILGYYGQSEE